MAQKDAGKRNFYALLLEGTLFITGLAFLDADTVVSVFIHTFTGSLKLSGLASTLRTASSIIAQLLLGPYIRRIKNMPAFMSTIMFLFRPLCLIMVPILALKLDPNTTVWIFLFIYTLLWASDGLVVVPWTDLLGRLIPGKKRGRLLGNQQVLGGIGSLIAGYIVKTTLDNARLSEPEKYSMLFSLAGIVLLFSSVAMLFVKDTNTNTSRPPANMLEYYRKLPGYLKINKDYSRMLAVQLIGSFSAAVIPFIVLFGKGTFGLSPAQVSTMIYIQIIGSLIGGFFWGSVSQHMGNRYVILVSMIISCIIPSLGLISLGIHRTVSPLVVLVPMCLLAGINKGSWMGYTNYTIDVVDEENRPAYFVLTSLITFPTTFLAYLVGVMADAFGFVPLFIIHLSTAIIATGLALTLKSPNDSDNTIQSSSLS
ncbi:MAG: MFS transporter [Clostridiales bacterium]|nr:MFS transporter [Clostridiales bacterium]